MGYARGGEEEGTSVVEEREGKADFSCQDVLSVAVMGGKEVVQKNLAPAGVLRAGHFQINQSFPVCLLGQKTSFCQKWCWHCASEQSKKCLWAFTREQRRKKNTILPDLILSVACSVFLNSPLTHYGRHHSLHAAVICFIVTIYFYICYLNCSCPGHKAHLRKAER